MSNPEVSAILCHHRGDFVYKAVQSIRKSIGVTLEIIIVTSDVELSLKGIDGCKVYFDMGMPAAKRNKGVRVASGKYLAFFDDDVEIDAKCLLEFKKVLDKDTHVGIVYGKLYKADEPERFDEAGGYLTSTGFIWSRAGQNVLDEGQFDEESYILAGKSASCMCSRAAFGAVRGFDEDFGILGEETDLSWRMWLRGFSVVFIPKAIGIHYFNTKFKPVKEFYTCKRVNYNGARNYLTMLLKCLGKSHLWILPIHFVVWLTASIVMIFTLKVKEGMNILGGLGSFVTSISKTLRKRKIIQSTRVVSEESLWPIIHRSSPNGYYKQRFLRYITLGLHG